MPTTKTTRNQRDKTLIIFMDICEDIIDAYAYLSIIYPRIWIDNTVNNNKRGVILKRALELK